MAPEQVRGDACDGQSDLFSLGAVMYVLCTGHVPFRAESVYGVLQRIVHDPPRSIREQNPQIPEWLEEFIFRLLAKERRNRFASADEVVRLLQEELACLQNPVSSTPPAREWFRRPRGLVSFTPSRTKWVASAALCFLVVTAAIWQAMRPEGDGTKSKSKDSAKSMAETASDSSSSATQSPVPLWNSDHIRDTQNRATALESAWQSPSVDSGPDSWSDQIADVRRRLAELFRDLEPPGPKAASPSVIPLPVTSPPPP